MTIRCIIVDDEPLARKGLREYIQEVNFLQLEAEFNGPVEAMDFLASNKVDLVFLDIQMPKLTGLQLVQSLKNVPHIVFTTAYPQYAVEGFEYNATDYLLKPIPFERFLRAVMKVKEQMQAKAQPSEESNAKEYVFIKTDSKLVKLNLDEIVFVEAVQNYVSIITSNKKYLSYLTFKSIEENLPPESFLKIHKSFIVSIAHVESIEGNMLNVAGRQLPISRSLKEEVVERLTAGRFWKRKE